MNKSVEKLLYISIQIIVLGAFAAFLYFNSDKMTQYFCPLMQKVYTSKLIYISLLIFGAAYAAGWFGCTLAKTKIAEKCSAYQKRHENISIEKDTDKARIAALEAKIATLETALDSALKNK